MSQVFHRFNGVINTNFPSYTLGGSYIRDVPNSESKYLDKVYINLPWSIGKDPKQIYPVVYLCDGAWDFVTVCGLYSHLLFDNVIPEFIIVGLGYGGSNPDIVAHRKINFDPTYFEVNECDNYLTRLKSNIIPFIESEYPVDSSFRCILGASSAGHFAIGTIFREPGLFNGIIALSPDMGGYNGWLLRKENEFYESRRTLCNKLLGLGVELNVKLFIGVGGCDEPRLLRDANAFDKQIDSHKYRFLEKQLRIIDGEKHGGAKAEGMNRGLRHVFASYMHA
jgi:uncharacterized protein